MAMSFNAGNYLRFAEALLAISVGANRLPQALRLSRTSLLPQQLQISTCA
jgi:hypothetical protein